MVILGWLTTLIIGWALADNLVPRYAHAIREFIGDEFLT